MVYFVKAETQHWEGRKQPEHHASPPPPWEPSASVFRKTDKTRRACDLGGKSDSPEKEFDSRTLGGVREKAFILLCDALIHVLFE